jgi:hypothetical protein
MKRKVLSPLIIILLLLMAFVTPVYSQSVSDASYTLNANGSPLGGTMTVTQGDTVNFDAVASFTFHKGSLPVSSVTPTVTATIDVYLMQGGNQVDHKTFYRTISDTTIADGQQSVFNTATNGGTIQYTVPNTVVGLCTLKLAAYVHADIMGLASYSNSQTKIVVLTVNAPAASVAPGATATPTPVPTPTPTALPSSTHTTVVNDSTAVHQADGTMRVNTTESTGSVTDQGGNTTKVAGSVVVDLSSAPANAEIKTYLVDKPQDNAANTQFMLAAAGTGGDISGIACVMVVEHPTLINGQEIKNATITMKASESWVTAHGGIDTVKILRYSNGASEALNTHYIGRDTVDSTMMVFEAVSPNGLSQFALAAVTKLPVSDGEKITPGVSVNTGSIIGIVAGVLILLLVIVGGVFLVLKRRKKNKKQ